jgi:branched-chain amino acid transport system permease protein
MGIDLTKYKVRAFVLSSFFAGVAGGLYAMNLGTINAANLGFQKSFEIIIMVVLGGMGSISGAALAAIILTFLPELLREMGGDFQQYRIIVYAALLVIMMLVRPQGLFGIREIWEVPLFRRMFYLKDHSGRGTNRGGAK